MFSSIYILFCTTRTFNTDFCSHSNYFGIFSGLLNSVTKYTSFFSFVLLNLMFWRFSRVRNNEKCLSLGQKN